MTYSSSCNGFFLFFLLFFEYFKLFTAFSMSFLVSDSEISSEVEYLVSFSRSTILTTSIILSDRRLFLIFLVSISSDGLRSFDLDRLFDIICSRRKVRLTRLLRKFRMIDLYRSWYASHSFNKHLELQVSKRIRNRTDSCAFLRTNLIKFGRVIALDEGNILIWNLNLKKTRMNQMALYSR